MHIILSIIAISSLHSIFSLTGPQQAAAAQSPNTPGLANFVQLSSDFSLNQQSCMSFQIGFDCFLKNMDAMFEQYIQRFNIKTGKMTVAKTNTYKNTEF